MDANDSGPRRLQAFLQTNAAGVHKLVTEGYAAEGRGVVLIDETLQHRAPVGMTEAVYLSDAAVTAAGIGWPDEWIAQRVKTYDPSVEYVAVLRNSDGSIDSVRGHFVPLENN